MEGPSQNTESQEAGDLGSNVTFSREMSAKTLFLTDLFEKIYVCILGGRVSARTHAYTWRPKEDIGLSRCLVP